MSPLAVKGSPSAGLFGATLGFFVGFAAVALFGPTARSFKEVMDLTPTMVGFLVAMPALSGSLLRIPFSAWVDTTGGRKPFLILLALSIVGMSGLAYIVNGLYPDRLSRELYPLLLLLGLLCGCGIATFSVGISQVAYWFPQKNQGRALGAYAGIGNLAPGMFSFLLPVVTTTLGYGLGGAYIAWLVFLIAGTLLYAMMGRNAWYFQFRQAGVDPAEARQRASACGQQIFPAGTPIQTLKISAAIWKTWALVGIYFTTFGGFLALTAWLPTYWSESFAIDGTRAGLLTALYAILTSLMRVAGGGISDRWGGERTAVVSLSVMLAGALMLALIDTLALCIAGEVLLALGMGVANAAVFKLVPQEVPQAVGGAAGWIGGLGAFGGFAIPPIMGLFVGRFGAEGYALGFFVFVGLAIVSIGLALILRACHAAGAPRPIPAPVK
jgi:NNP family nitrate/nitrite transporter-like MFS transporter